MKPTENDVTWAMGIMQKLFNLGFYEAISYHQREEDECKYYHLGLYDWKKENRHEIRKMPIRFASGETKVCIMSDDNPDWVIKVGFLRSTDPGYVESGTAQDFCELEAEYYSKACDNNIEEYFAATYKIGEIKGVSIFMQEFAEVDSDFFNSFFTNYMSEGTSYKEWCEDRGYDDDDSSSEEYEYYLTDLIDDMDNCDRVYAVLGEDCKDVVEFIEEHNINDLHEGNWGVTRDGRYVMIDYSGYKG